MATVPVGRVLICYTSYNRLAYTKRTLPALLQWACRRGKDDVRIAVCDDGSTDGSREWLQKYEQAHRDRFARFWSRLIIAKTRRGNAISSNVLWRLTEGDIVKWDNDVIPRRDDWLDALREVVEAVPRAGVVAHNCEATLRQPYREVALDGVTVALSDRQYHTVAGACVYIPARTREKCGRWNEYEAYQAFNRGNDLVYSVKVRMAGLLSLYTTGRKNVYVKCLQGKESPDYIRERSQMKGRVGLWAVPVVRAYQQGLRPLDDVP